MKVFITVEVDDEADLHNELVFLASVIGTGDLQDGELMDGSFKVGNSLIETLDEE